MAIVVSMAIAAITDIRAINQVMVLKPIVINTTTSANREMYAIKAIELNNTIMTITANAVNTAIMVIRITTNLFITATIAITTNIEQDQVVNSSGSVENR